MKKKNFLYLGLILFAINIGNGNFSKLYSFLRQRIIISSTHQEKVNLCYPLQKKIENNISEYRSNISISILNDYGDFIVDVNGNLPRIPASNQKILSSAYSLDKLGPSYTLKTSIKKLSNDSFYLEASGDPDFDEIHLVNLISELKNKNINKSDGKILLILKDFHSSDFWPSSWSNSDRKEEYGAPISKYSISSNSSLNALNNPLINFIDKLEIALKRNNLSNKFIIKIVDKNYTINNISTVKTFYSAPLSILLNLVNSESHNFTSEVIFRHSLNNWSHDFPNKKYTKWLNEQNINSSKFIFADASGLSRNNRVTTFGLSQFLRRMKSNRFSEYYFSSFSILGVRGSLSNISIPSNIKGKVLAKSGTLTNVKSISGIIPSKNLFFSIIVNNMDNSLKNIINILSIIYNDKLCT
tara:strand:- start:11292 stop:12530 length:1239 start_codon:yes stop_codon:yes gene_type:complete